MDEPLSNLDAKLRVQMRSELTTLQNDLGVTTLYVTHDQVEAMTMGDRVAVMRKGELQQVDAPQTLYDRPVNIFVAGFIGSPAMNLLEGTLSRSDGDLVVELGDQHLPLDRETVALRPALSRFEGRKVVVGIRPEDLEDPALLSDAPDGARLRGRVRLTEALGSEVLVHFNVAARPALTDDVRELAEDAGQTIEQPTGDTTIVGRFGSRTKVREGEAIEVAVDTRALHFFELDTGLGIYGGGSPA
jgi:multiple sugar transport system ATP-binding protein